MVKLSANLGYLWTELELTDAVRAAAANGFDAVETHWPYVTHALDVALALEETGLPMVCINTVAGDLPQGDFGLAAVPGREIEARSAIDKALSYAADIAAGNVHVLAGRSEGPEARNTFIDNLAYAAGRGRDFGVGVLIEPINRHDQPGYFLSELDQAVAIVRDVGDPTVRIMFDCYHAHRTEGDGVADRIAQHLEMIGHIQIASVPDRAEPDHGAIDYEDLFDRLDSMGYEGYVGAEYRPNGATDNGLGWLRLRTRSGLR